MGLFGAMFADRILGPADEATGQRPGDPTGAASIAMGAGTAALGAAAAAAMAPNVLANIRGGMEGLVSDGRNAGPDPMAASALTTPATAKASTPDLPALG